MTVFSKYVLFILMSLFVIGLSGCNTFRGMGQDMEEAGETIDETAEDVEEEMDD